MKSTNDIIHTLLKSKNIQNPKSFEELGYIFFGPLVFNYFIWLSEEIKDSDVILFNSREGFFLKKLYNIFKLKFNLPDSIYFKTSRALSSKISLFKKDDVYNTFKLHRYNGTISSLLKHRFNIEVNDDTLIDTQIKIPNLDNYVDTILYSAEKSRNLYKKYINETLKDYKKIVMVDSGFQGTSQHNIETTYNLNFKGRYFTYKGNLPLSNTKGFYNFDICNLKDNLIFFESIFVDTIGTYVDINEQGFVNETIKNYNIDKINEIIMGVETFILNGLDNTIDFKKNDYILPDFIFNLMCSKNFIKNEKMFDVFFHDNSYVRRDVKKVYRNE